MSENLIELIHTQIQNARNTLDSNSELFKKSWKDPIPALESNQEIARLTLIASINNVLTNSSLKVRELNHQHLRLLQRLNAVCQENIESTPAHRRINLEEPQCDTALKSLWWELVTLLLGAFSGICILDVLCVLIIINIAYLAGAASAATLAGFALPFLILIGAGVVFGLSALIISPFSYEPRSLVQENIEALHSNIEALHSNIEALHSNVRHYNGYLNATGLFYTVKKAISTSHPDESSTIRSAFKKYQAIIINDNMAAADSSLMFYDVRLIGRLNSEYAVQWSHLVKNIEETDTQYTRAKKELLQALLKHAYQEDNKKRLADSGDDQVFKSLRDSSLSPEKIHHYLNRFESIQNQKNRTCFDWFSRIETSSDLLNEITTEIQAMQCSL